MATRRKKVEEDMAQTVTAPRVGVTGNEHLINAAMHSAHDRSTVKGVTIAESTANAVQNTQLANE